ncbi:hypothetical protein R6Q59_016376 [Mikania micrantha]
MACFFVGEDEEDMISILEEDLYAKSGIMTLIDRCLITVSPGGELMMHQLLQDMGKRIVYDESKFPAKRSRVWHDDESYRVLIKGDIRCFLCVSLSLFSIRVQIQLKVCPST